MKRVFLRLFGRDKLSYNKKLEKEQPKCPKCGEKGVCMGTEYPHPENDSYQYLFHCLNCNYVEISEKKEWWMVGGDSCPFCDNRHVDSPYLPPNLVRRAENMSRKRDRLGILEEIRNIVGSNSSEGSVKETKVFCIEDGEPIAAGFWQPEGYTHKNHTNDRAFIFYPTTKWEFRDDGELRHFSVGCILWRQEENEQEKRYCLFRRRSHPIGYYAIPAGHLEMGEDPKMAALREAYEETQLGILSAEPFYEGEIKEECRRGSNFHYWYVYLCQCTGEPRMNDEAYVIGWFTRDEIINELKHTKPSGFFYSKLFGETPRNIREI